MKLKSSIPLFCTLFLLTSFFGCTRMGPRMIPRDRYDYATAIGESWKNQALLNIVKLRNGDWPVFLEVTQIVTGYNWEVTGNTLFEVGYGYPDREESGRRRWLQNDQAFKGSLTGKTVERPTITYQLLAGERFVKSILLPIRPSILLTMTQTGWSANRMFRVMVHSVNGKINSNFTIESENTADPTFIRFCLFLREAQIANALSIRIKRTKDEQKSKSVANAKLEEQELALIAINNDLLVESIQKEWLEIKTLLNLDPGLNSFKVSWDPQSATTDTIAIRTRSVLQVLRTLGNYVEVSKSKKESERAIKSGPVEEKMEEIQEDIVPLLKIHRGKFAPRNTFAKVRYRGESFWIAEDDANSKRTFSYLSMLLAITESGESKGPPLVLSAD